MRYAALLALLTLLLGFSEPAEGAGVEVKQSDLTNKNELTVDSGESIHTNLEFSPSEEKPTQEPTPDPYEKIKDLGIDIKSSQIVEPLIDLFIGSRSSMVFDHVSGCFTFQQATEETVNAVNTYYNDPNLLLATFYWLSQSDNFLPFGFYSGIVIEDKAYSIRIDPNNGMRILQNDGIGSTYYISDLTIEEIINLSSVNGFSIFEIGGSFEQKENITEDQEKYSIVQRVEAQSPVPLGITMKEVDINRTQQFSYVFLTSGDITPYEISYTYTTNIQEGENTITAFESCGTNNVTPDKSYRESSIWKGKLDQLDVQDIGTNGSIEIFPAEGIPGSAYEREALDFRKEEHSDYPFISPRSPFESFNDN